MRTPSHDPAQFLLDLTGRGVDQQGRANHIVMLDTPPRPGDPQDRKFTTVWHHPTLNDCRGHLAGERTISGYLTCAPGSELARVVVFDGDGEKTGHTLAFLADAANKLLAAGARPLLEASPADGDHGGGGKLLLAFDQPVRWRDAQATAYHYAPELRELERFPPARVRMPGGLYRRGVFAWCELQAHGSGEGDYWYTAELAVHVLMETPTPTEWVTVQAISVPDRRTVIVQGTIPYRERNTTLFRLACVMRRAGFEESAIAAALSSTNAERCIPSRPTAKNP